MVHLLAVTLCIAYEFLLLVNFFCILEDLQFLFHQKKQGKYPKIQPRSGSMFFNDFDKNNIKNNNYVLNLGILPALPMPLHALLALCFAPPPLTPSTLAHAACPNI